LSGVIYSVVASVINILITTPLSMMYFAEVIIAESGKREKIMKKGEMKVVKGEVHAYQKRMKRTFLKLQCIVKWEQLLKVYIEKRKSLQENEVLSSFIEQTQIAHNLSQQKKTEKYMDEYVHKGNNESLCLGDADKTVNDAAEISLFHANNDITTMEKDNSYIVSLGHQSEDDEEEIKLNQFTKIHKIIRSFKLTRMRYFFIARIPVNDLTSFRSQIRMDKRPSNFPLEHISEEPNMKDWNLDCLELTIGPTPNYGLKRELKKQILKTVKLGLTAVILLYVWYWLAVFIQSIYTQYGTNIVKIVIMPLVSMLFTKFVITFNIMLFLSTILVYFFGARFYANSKSSLEKIIFGALVPIIALNHHKAILMFRQIVNPENSK
jgi:hypothetical protein